MSAPSLWLRASIAGFFHYVKVGPSVVHDDEPVSHEDAAEQGLEPVAVASRQRDVRPDNRPEGRDQELP